MAAGELKTKPPRAGEELDGGALARFLGAHVDGLAGVAAEAIRVTQFPGGHSNLTYLLTVETPGTKMVREPVLRRPPFGNRVKNAHDVTREARYMKTIAPRYPRVPNVVAIEDDESVLGAPFFLMDPVRGAIFRRTPPPGVTVDGAIARTLSETTVDGLAELHRVVVDGPLAELGKPEGFVRRQVSGWTERWRRAATDDVPDMDVVSDWIGRHVPAADPAGPAALVHNDWKLDNFVLDESDYSKIRCVLDWEMAAIGDPLIDVGTMLSYWVESGDPEEQQFFAFGPTNAPGALTRAEAVARYAEKSGRDVSNVVFFFAFACFKTAVVAAQIYARYKKGLTTDERFAMMIVGVKVLAAAARRAIETGKV